MFHPHYSTVLCQICVLTVQKRTHCNNDYQICTKQLEIQNKKGEKNNLKDTTFIEIQRHYFLEIQDG